MFARLAALALASVLAACGTPPAEDPPARDFPVTAERFDPGCGTFADPFLNTFNGCNASTIGQYARVDTAEDGPEVYRCTENGFEHVEGRCRFYGDDLWCGCGVDDGPDGPAP